MSAPTSHVIGRGNRWHAALLVKRGWWVADTVGGPIFECSAAHFDPALKRAKEHRHFGRTQPTAYRVLVWLYAEAERQGEVSK